MNQPVSTMFALYLERSDFRPATIALKQRALEFFVEWFGDPPVRQVDATVAGDYLTMLMKGRSRSAARTYLDNFKPFWRWLLRRGYINREPFVDVTLRVDEERKRDTFTPAELSRLMLAATPLERIWGCLGLLGCRRGELLNILVRDVQFRKKVAYIELSPKKKSVSTWPWGTKNHKLGIVALPGCIEFDDTSVFLQEDVRNRIDQLHGRPDAYLCVPIKYTEKLLTLQSLGELTWDQIKDPCGNHPRMFQAWQRRAGITRPKRYHELRAAFATTMIQPLGLSRTADAMRHASVQQTREYDRTNQLSLVAEISRIAEHSYVSS